jgi:polyhydroxyalkanoate synthesis regulator phasin
MRARCVVLALLALPLTACSAAAPTAASKFKGDQANVAKVVDDLAAAGRKGDANAICANVLAKQLVAELKTAGGDCETEMKRAIQDASDYDLQVRSVVVKGTTATAQVRQGKAGQVATFSFVKESGGWRATALGG